MTTYSVGGWQPDSILPEHDATQDYKFNDNEEKFVLAGAQVNMPGVETNGVLDLRKWCSPVENQSSAGSCVGNGVVGALEFLQIRNGQPFSDLSRLFVYYNSRLMHKSQDKDSGTYISLAFGTLSSLGTCAETKWPYDLSKLFIRPTWGSYREAYANKIDSYYKIGGVGQTRIDFIQRALRAQHVVVFGMTVDKTFMDYAGGIMAMPTPNRQTEGGHCMVIVGYDNNTQCWIVRNSWGIGWGENGYAYIPYAYLDASSANDFWVPYLPNSSMENG